MDQLQNLTNPQPGREDVGGDFLKKMTKLRLGVFVLSAVVLIGGGVYLLSTAFGDSSEPPALQLSTASMSKGMASSRVAQIPGFAKFTDADVDAYKCDPKFEVNLGSRTVNLFAKQKTTLKEIAAAIHPTKGAQYLIAFFEPAKEDATRPVDTYYLYPTNLSPFKNTKKMNVTGILDGDFEVPAYRGFQLLTDNPDTLFCKGSLFKTATDGIWYTKDGKEISFELSAKILKSMKILPKGWVMLPAGNNTSIIGGFYDLFGKDVIDTAYYQADSGEFKEFNYDKDWNSAAETGTKLSHNAVWFHLNKKVNVDFIIDEILAMLEEQQSGGAKKEVKAKAKTEVEAETETEAVKSDDAEKKKEVKVEDVEEVQEEVKVDEEVDVNCEVDSSDPKCNPVNAGEGGCEGDACIGDEGVLTEDSDGVDAAQDSKYYGNSMESVSTFYSKSVESLAIDRVEITDKEVRIYFNVGAGEFSFDTIYNEDGTVFAPVGDFGWVDDSREVYRVVFANGNPMLIDFSYTVKFSDGENDVSYSFLVDEITN